MREEGEKVPCLLCGSITPVYLAEVQGVPLVRCGECHLVFQSPRRPPEMIRKFYRDEYSQLFPHEKDERHRTALFQSFLDRFPCSPGARLLDVGCGWGRFLVMAQEKGWKVYGTDLSRDTTRYVKESLGIDGVCGDLTETRFPSDYFDAITLWNVLEHCPDPLEQLQEIHRVLKPSGVLFLRVPNFLFQWFSREIFQKITPLFPGEKPLEDRVSVFHLYSFTPFSLQSLLRRAGFLSVITRNSPLTSGDPYGAFPLLGVRGMDLIKRGLFLVFQGLYYLSARRWIWGPSFEVVARKNRRVLHIITRLAEGGSAENTLDTVEGLNKHGYEASLLTGPTRPPESGLEAEAYHREIKMTLIPELVRQIHPLSDLIAFVKIFRHIRQGDFEIVHTHTSKAGIIGRGAAWLAGVPLIIHTPHGHIFYGYFDKITTLFFVLLERLCAFLTDRIITLTQRGAEEHIRFRIARPEKFVPIPSGVRLEEFRSIRVDPLFKKRELGLRDLSPIVGHVGRLVPIKGQRYLIAAAQSVVSSAPETHFIIVGEGELQKDLEAQAERLGIKNHVHFIGERKDLPDIFSLFDLFVLPSLNEGMGRVLIQAMAMGKPVIATEVGGVPEIVIDGVTGILVPPQDPDRLASALLELLRDPQRARAMGEEGRKRVDTRFSVETMVKRIEELYQGLLREKEEG